MTTRSPHLFRPCVEGLEQRSLPSHTGLNSQGLAMLPADLHNSDSHTGAIPAHDTDYVPCFIHRIRGEQCSPRPAPAPKPNNPTPHPAPHTTPPHPNNPGNSTHNRPSLLNQQSLYAYCYDKLGYRVGGGECAQLASEALRILGARFVSTPDASLDPDSAEIKQDGEYVWGKLVRLFAPGTASYTPVKVGDILQYHNADFAGGHTAHHTSIVAAVDSNGIPTYVFEQNVRNANGTYDRFVHLDPIHGLTGITGGWVRAYRPVARPANDHQVVFSVVNNLPKAITIVIDGARKNMSKANTPATVGVPPCHATYTFDGGGQHKLSVSGLNGFVMVQDQKGYVIDTSGIRPLVFSSRFPGKESSTGNAGLTLLDEPASEPIPASPELPPPSKPTPTPTPTPDTTTNLRLTDAFLTDHDGTYQFHNGQQAPALEGTSVLYVQVLFQTQDLPAGASYVISQTVNGVTLTDRVSYGAGMAGVHSWYHRWGPFHIVPGTNSISASLDVNNDVHETSGADNSSSFTVTGY